METKNEGARLRAIKLFWDWFTANAASLKTLYLSQQFENLSEQVNTELNKIEPLLAWEIGPGIAAPNLLTISAEGDPRLRQIADLVIHLAPPLDGWEFYSSRPARPRPAVVRLPESGESFETSNWEFVPVEQAIAGRLNLVIVDDHLASADRETSLRAVSIYIDELLGEDTVETWIGEFKIESRIAALGKTAYKMTELPDYLFWATNRKANPLKRSNII